MAVKEEISKLLNSPTITMFNRVDAWIEQGADPERDIYPAIKAGLAKLQGAAPRSLRYFDGFVADALAARTTPLAKGTARFSPAPTLSAEEKEANRLEGYAWMIERKRSPGLHCSQVDIRKLIAMGRITQAQADAVGLAA
jgi:hypothetical protein